MNIDLMKWIKGAEMHGDGRYPLKKNQYKSADGSDGLTTTIIVTTPSGTSTLVFKNGLLTEVI